MTLSARIFDSIISGLMLFALIPFFFACNDPNALGVELDKENAQTEVTTVEFVLPVKTVFIDSLRTNFSRKIVYGSITDNPDFGDLKATGYTEYNLGTGTLPSDSVEFVRSSLVLRSVNSYLPDNEFEEEKMNVFLTTDTLFSTVIYLSNQHVGYDNTTPIGQFASLISNEDSIFSIDLGDFGHNLYVRLDSAQNNEAYFDSLNTSAKPALVLEPLADNNSLITFDLNDDTTGIYLEMKHIRTGEILYYKFLLNGDYHTEIKRDRTGSAFESLVNDYDSIDSSNSVFNSLAGLHPKLDLAPFLDFLKENENIVINRADLRLPIEELKKESAVERVQYYIPNASGRVDGPGIYLSGSNVVFKAVLSNNAYLGGPDGINSVLTNDLDTDALVYSANVTNFCQQELDVLLYSDDFFAKNLIVYSPNALNATQSILKKSDIKLKLYYTKLK